MTRPPGLSTETIGRHDVINDVTTALASRRLVTLIGSPGIGKTRIALESVRRLEDEQQEIAFVELHAATNRLDILRLVRQVMGIDPDRGIPGSIESSDDDLDRWLIERLADASIVLLIDNCEHVADDVAGFVRKLLPVAPSVTVLATSRRPLWVDGEHLVIVGPLDQPHDGSWAELAASPAGRLFLERSSAAGVVWHGSHDDAAIVSEVCRRLDGVPLAIELAAARTRWMPLERLLDDLADVSPERNSGAQPLTASLRSPIGRWRRVPIPTRHRPVRRRCDSPGSIHTDRC